MTSVGLALSLFVVVFAVWRSTRTSTNYYETQVYGITRKTHRWYAIVSLLFAALFAAAYFTGVIPVVPLLAVYVLVAVFYFSSFARGFSDEQ